MATELNMADRLAIREVIVPRCGALVAKYALYVMNATVGGGVGQVSQEQKNWAAGAIRNPQQIGQALSWHVIDQPVFMGVVDGQGNWSGGSMISDDVLGGILETAINTHYIAQAS